ncbi:MAG TPA: hypothetical protein VKT82_24710 [Ktedonobacterales bacterium]|nr:hypothetical protein [Ktedonobacterales bacterium]
MPEEQPQRPPVNVEALARLFKRQADLTKKLYAQRLVLAAAPAEIFTAFEAEELYKQFLRERRALRKIAARLEEATGRAMGPIELYYVV